LIVTFTVIALDENGSEYSSRDFSNVVYKGLEDGGANLTFVIGGFAGLPSEIKKSYPLISLSKVFTTSEETRSSNLPFSNFEY
jgi:23S rRNA pseudoU1915 N3-methylase RlmH